MKTAKDARTPTGVYKPPSNYLNTSWRNMRKHDHQMEAFSSSKFAHQGGLDEATRPYLVHSLLERPLDTREDAQQHRLCVERGPTGFPAPFGPMCHVMARRESSGLFGCCKHTIIIYHLGLGSWVHLELLEDEYEAWRTWFNISNFGGFLK